MIIRPTSVQITAPVRINHIFTTEGTEITEEKTQNVLVASTREFNVITSSLMPWPFCFSVFSVPSVVQNAIWIFFKCSLAATSAESCQRWAGAA